MEFNINSFDLLMMTAGVMFYAIGAAVWTCMGVPELVWGTPAIVQTSSAPFKLENSNEFL